jgi:ABC-type lipoprotein release transport system permease subunit
VVIVVIAYLIAFFTARRAARLRAADALRHYE